MPPRRPAVKANLQPLQGQTITTSGRFPGTTTTSLSVRIKRLGGSYTAKLDEEVGVVISSPRDFDEGTRSMKVSQALEKGVKVVGLGWFDAVEEDQASKVDIEEYLMGNNTENESKDTSGSGSKTSATALDFNSSKSTSKTSPGTDNANPEPTIKPRRGKRTRPASPSTDSQPPVTDSKGKDGETPTKKLKATPRCVDVEDGDGMDGSDGMGAVKDGKLDSAGGEKADKSFNPAASTSSNKPTTSAKQPTTTPTPAQPAPTKTKPTAAVGRSQTLKRNKSAHIPVDEHFQPPTVGSGFAWKVWIDGGGLVWDASLNQTNAGKNSNKFYKIQLLHDPTSTQFYTWTRWGRVGERGQNALLGGGSLGDAQGQFEKKFKDKSGLKWADRAGEPRAGKYAYVEKSYQPDTDDEDEAGPSSTGKGKKKASPSPVVESTLAKPVQSLLGLLFSQQYQQEALLSLNYDTEKMPLGKLSKGTISRGFQTLKDLAAIMNATVFDQQQIEPLSNRYYSLIPHTFGRNRPPVINTHERLKQEIDLLESLSDMKEANGMFNQANREIENDHQSRLDRQFETLGMEEMEPVDTKSTEFSELADYLVKTKGDTHHVDYRVQDIFRIQRKGESEKFDSNAANRRLLWHGSRVTNFAGILSQGLRIAPPEAPVSGYMFGKGIYLADMSSKSANYCASDQSGGTALLLLCEAELGDPVLELTNASYTAGEDALAKGMKSTWGKGRVRPKVWKDAGCIHPSLVGTSMPDVSTVPGETKVDGAYLQYNEYIAYDIVQVRLRYLLRVRM